MITLRELNYVSSWASKAPYPGVAYAEGAAKKLIASVDAYEQFYKNKEYDLILSNGEQFSFEIAPMNLCHMLGVDYKNLSGDYFREFREDVLKMYTPPRSYDLLKGIIEHIDDVLKYDEERSGKILNYYRIMVKCSIFEKMSNFSKFNFGVINFDKEAYEHSSSGIYHGNAEKFLYVQSNEQVCPYFMMGILPTKDRFDNSDSIEERFFEEKNEKDEDGKNKDYVVETLFAPTNVRDFFCNQIVSIPTQILTTTTDAMIKKEATPANKIALLNQYKAIVTEYGIPNNIDIYSDYMAMLSNLDIESSKTLTKTK